MFEKKNQQREVDGAFMSPKVALDHVRKICFEG